MLFSTTMIPYCEVLYYYGISAVTICMFFYSRCVYYVFNIYFLVFLYYFLFVLNVKLSSVSEFSDGNLAS